MADGAQSKRRASAWPSRLILHLLLLSVAAAFLFPFAWMLLTAAKTDEEIAAGKWLPAMPGFRATSPYVRASQDARRPEFVSQDNWERLAPAIIRELERAMSGSSYQPAIQFKGMGYPVNELFQILVNRLPVNTWQKQDGEIIYDFVQAISDLDQAAAYDRATARLELLQLQIRTLEARIFNVCDTRIFAQEWEVESGSAKLSSTPNTTWLSSDFSEQQAAVVLRYDFDFPCAPAELHKLILSLKPDDSWHRIDAELTIDGQTWRSTRSSYLAQHRPTSIIFQPPTFEDETYQPKIWIPLKPTALFVNPRDLADGSAGASPSTLASTQPAHRATLRIILTPSSTPQAIWGKLTRNYVRIFNSIPFWKYLANSLLLVVLTVTGTLFSSTFVAYAFARLHWPGRSIALLILLSTLMLPEQVTMIPSFLIWQKLGWYNTLNPIWVPTFFGATFTPLFGSAFFIYLMVQHMRTLPKELEEAARIDGLGHVQTWWYIMLPQVKPAAAAIATLSFLAAWNDFLRPLIYLRDQGRFPLSLGLLTAQIENRGDWTMIMAGNVLMTLPVILLFFLAQRSFVRGMSGSGLK